MRVLFCFVLLTVPFCYSQEAEIEQSLVVTGQFIPVSAKDSIFLVKIIDREEIDSKAAMDVKEALGFELGMKFNQHSVFGSGLAIQGLSNEQVKVLVDGVPVVGRLNGILDFNQLQLCSVERIEVIEGPLSVFYGTDAIAGVIHLITRKKSPSTWRANLDGQYNSKGEIKMDAGLSLRDKSHHIWLSGGARQFDGLNKSDQRSRDWNERNQNYGHINYSTNWNGFKFNLGSDFFDEVLIDLGEPGRTGVAIDKRYRTNRQNHQISTQGILNKTFMEIILAYSAYDRDHVSRAFDPNTSVSSPITHFPDSSQLDFWMLKGMASSQTSGQTQFQVGFEATSEEGRGDRISDARQSVQEVSVFGGVKWMVRSNFHIQPSIRVSSNSQYGSPITPSLYARYKLGRMGDVRFSYSRGFRAPSIKELFLDFAMATGPITYHINGNSKLNAERSHSYLLSHHVEFLKSGINSQIFSHDIENQIALSAITPELDKPGHFSRYYLNVSSHRSRGFKVESYYEPSWGKWTTGVAYSTWDNELSDQIRPKKSHATDFSLGFSKLTDRLGFHVHYTHTDRRPGYYIPTGQIQVYETMTDAYDLLDTVITFNLGSWNIETGAKNVFDVQNLDTIDSQTGTAHQDIFQGWGRTAFIRLRYRWGDE